MRPASVTKLLYGPFSSLTLPSHLEKKKKHTKTYDKDVTLAPLFIHTN